MTAGPYPPGTQEFADGFRRPQTSRHWGANLDPLSKIAIAVALLFPAVAWFSGPVSAGIVALYLLVAVTCGRLRSFLRVFVRLAALIGAFFFALRAVFLPGDDVVTSLGPLTVTMEGVDQGVRMAALMVAVCGAIVLLTVVVKPGDLAYALEKKNVPASFTYIIVSTVHTITDLGTGARRILDSQRARGIETEGNVITRTKAFLPTLGPLFLGAIVAAEEKAIAMDARGFSGNTRHTHLRDLRPVPLWEKLLVTVVAVAAGVATGWGILW